MVALSMRSSRAPRWVAARVAVVVALALAAALAGSRPARATDAAPPSDLTAVQYAAQLLDAMGGQAAWDTLGTVRFAFTVSRRDTVLTSRTHYWDKRSMRDRIEGLNRAGKRYCILVDLTSKQARSWVDGVAQTGADSASYATRGFALWTNDSYWLFMPYKLRDPGVTLHDDGDTLEVGVRYHRVRLTFGAVGLTPGDTYWAYINASSHMMEKWHYVLQGEDHDQGTWWWDGWTRIGPVMLSPMRRNADGEPMAIELRDLAYLGRVPESVWTSPDPVPAR